MTTVQRQTAAERREAVLAAAKQEFGAHGLHGASTEAIARRAGISQPYLFRLFGSKKQLFLAVTDACFAETLETFREAASGKAGKEALRAMGEAYIDLLARDRAMLQCQLQAYAASVHDEEVRDSTARGYGRVVDYVEAVCGTDRHEISMFFATGMLLNILAAVDHTLGKQPRDGWIARLVEGCKGGTSE
jgi:AcrR family transcriptional regulator